MTFSDSAMAPLGFRPGAQRDIGQADVVVERGVTNARHLDQH